MIKHIRTYRWEYIFLFIVLVFTTLNFRTLLYLATKNPELILGASANAEKTVIRFSSTSGKFQVGDVVVVNVLVDTPKNAINADSGSILFPTDKLEIKSISTSDSINKMWIPTTPYFSTSTNSILFSGGLPTPGFNGTSGKILTVSFSVKAPGSAQLSFGDVQILANDGQGTQVDVAPEPITLALTPRAASQRGDLNGDDKANLTDLSILIANWGTPKLQAADLNGDGVVDSRDMSILLSKVTIAP